MASKYARQVTKAAAVITATAAAATIQYEQICC